MRTNRRAFNRRELLAGFGRAAAVAAVAPSLLGGAGDGASAATLAPAAPEDVGMCSARIENVFARIARRVADGLFPGAVALVARRGGIVGHRAFGTKVRGEDEPVTLDTIFDLQSMTKVLATATSAMALVHCEAIALHQRVADLLPDFAANGKGDITLRDMLRYAAGLPLDNQDLDNPDDAAVWKMMAETPLEYATGTSVLYSDLTYRLLGRALEAASGVDLDTLARHAVWEPLGMRDTMFNPPAALVPRIAATGISERRGCLVRGEVQDEQDFALGGITGCDGVFSTAMDIAIFCQMMLNRGRYGGARILSPQLSREMVKNQTPHVTEEETDLSPVTNLLLTPKGYGWELWTRRFSNGGMRLSPGSFGKAGGAGTFMWIDPERELFGVLLTNHGLPVPFDEIGWNRMLDAIGCAEFFDGIVNAVADD
jgi:CubicO group peptidase (beta-lactamase class C family)